MFEANIAEQIRAAWIAAAQSRNQADMAAAVPDQRDLLTLLEVAFLASIEREERTPIRARLVFFPDATPSTLQEHARWIDALPFRDPLPLSPENVAKISPAFDEDSSALAVARRGDGAYAIVGALFYGRMITRLESGQASLGRPRALIMSMRAPGSIAIAFGESVVGRYERGRLIRADPGPMASVAFVNHVVRTISGHAAYRDHKMEYWYLYRDCLERLYFTASRAGHGGTILWCPSDRVTDAAARIQSGTPVTSRTSGHQLAATALRHRATARQDANFGPVASDSVRRLSEFLDFVARLACVDGALLVDDEILPHRFRGHIAAGRWAGRVLEGSAGGIEPSRELDISRFGARHNSAIDLVGECPGVVAFVISEDGPVRAIMQVGADVIIWPDCLNTVFLD